MLAHGLMSACKKLVNTLITADAKPLLATLQGELTKRFGVMNSNGMLGVAMLLDPQFKIKTHLLCKQTSWLL